MKTAKIHLYPLAGALAALLPASLNAADITWDGDTDTNFTTGTNWVGDVAPTNDLVTDTAILTGTSIDLSSDYSLLGLTLSGGTQLFSTGILTLGAGGIQVNGNSDIFGNELQFNQNIQVTLNGGRLSTRNTVLSGTGQLTVSGNNNLFIDQASNTYSGGTLVTGGASVWIKGTNGIGTGGVTLDNGSLRRNGVDFGLNQAITVNAGGGTLFFDGNFSGSISGTGALTIQGEGTERTFSSTGTTHSGGITLDNAFFRTNGNDSYGTGVITMKNGSVIKNNNNNLTFDNDIVLEDGGGQFEAGWSKGIVLNGTISGTGGLTIRDDSGTTRILGNNTYSGGTSINANVQIDHSDSLGTNDITIDNGGQLKNDNSSPVLANNVIIGAGGGELMAGWNQDLTINGVVSGTGNLTIVGDSGTVVLGNANNTFGGNLILQDANSKVDIASLGSDAVISGDASAGLDVTGDVSFDGVNTFAGTYNVDASGAVGGNGSIAGSLVFAAGAGLIFDGDNTGLTVSGTVTFDNSFGIDDVSGLDGSTAVGTYLLIANAGDFSNIENFGESNAFDLGSGKSAYFQNGSLELVVVPEPSTFALIGGLLALASVMIRRRA